VGRVVKTIYPSVSPHGPTYSHVGYDSLGRRTWQSEQTVYSDGNDPNIIGKEFEYDDTGRLRAVILPDVNDPCNSDTRTYPRYEYDYDKYGNLTCISDNIKQYADDSIDYNDVRETSFTYGPLHNQVSRRLPDGRIEFKQYDNLGRLKKSTDFKAQITGYDYNARGLLEYKKFYANDTLYTYDEPNQLYEYSYDNLGRNLAVEVNDIDAANVDTYLYDYDDQGQITEVNTPQGPVAYEYYDTERLKSVRTIDANETKIAFAYDPIGRLATVNVQKRNGADVNEVFTYRYNDVGSLESLTYPNGNYAQYLYNELNRLVELNNWKTDAQSNNLTRFVYALAADGKRESVTEVFDSQETTIQWGYDDLSRVITEDYNAPGTSNDFNQTYVYDLVGNRLRTARNGTVTYYHYNINDQLAKTSSDPNGLNVLVSYDYDDNGSLIEEDGGTAVTAYTYNLLNRLVSMDNGTDTVNYTYGPDGMRVEKQVVGAQTITYLIAPYTHTGFPQVLKESDSTTEISYIAGLSILAQVIDANDPQYLLADGHGSIRQIADPAGVVLENYYFDAYGQLLSHSDPPSTNILYVSQMWDTHLDRYNNWHRWYAPDVGLFNRMDEFSGNQEEPQSLHKYLYTHADPVNGGDPSGLFTTPDLMLANTIRNVLADINITVNQAAEVSAETALRGGSAVRSLVYMAAMNTVPFLIGPALARFGDLVDDVLASFLKQADAGAIRIRGRTLTGMTDLLDDVYKTCGKNKDAAEAVGDIGASLLAKMQGWEFVGRFTNASGHGIDQIWKTGRTFIIVEAKGGSGKLFRGQMSRRWIRKKMDIVRSFDRRLADELLGAINNKNIKGMVVRTRVKGTSAFTPMFVLRDWGEIGLETWSGR